MDRKQETNRSKVVMVAGKFDVLHPGHLNFFKQAKQHGDKLIVVLARDSTIQKETKKNPCYAEQHRKEFLEATHFVDEVILGNEGPKTEIIKEIRPNIICLGYDQEINEEKLKAFIKDQGLKTKVIRLKPFKETLFKSTLIKKTVKFAQQKEQE